MTCRDFPLLYSAQLDGHAAEAEQLWLQQHLRACVTCRRRAAELRTLRAELRALDTPPAQRALTARLQWALRAEARAQERLTRQRADWVEVWRTRLFSQGIGALVSMAVFLVSITGVLRPAYRALALGQAATEVIFAEPEGDDIKLKVLLLQPPPPPVFSPSGELLNVGASLSEDDEIIATVKVSKDGRASINQIVGTQRDPAVVEKFSNVLIQQASFQPTRQKQTTSREAVVILSKVNISG